MCTILKEIGGLSASELLKKYDIDLTPPINLSDLIKKIGISSYPWDFSQVEDAVGYKRGDIVGAALSEKDDLHIMYAKGLSSNRSRFTVAHELGHCCLHAEDLKINHLELRLNNHHDKREEAANIFAGELLIPKEPLMNVYQRLLRPSISTLSEIFSVSYNVMKKRLARLDIPVIDDKFFGMEQE